jgi:hypothetical protein
MFKLSMRKRETSTDAPADAPAQSDALRIFTAERARAVRLSLPAGRVVVTVDPTAHTAKVLLRPADLTDQEAIDAIAAAEGSERRATVVSTEQILHVEVPTTRSGITFGPNGSVSVVGSGSVVAVGPGSIAVGGNMVGNMITVNGQVVTGGGAVIVGSKGVEALIVLPADGQAFISTQSASVDLTGALDRAEVTTVSGDVEADRVGHLKVTTTSGEVTVKQAGNLRVKTVSGGVVADRVEDGATVSTTSGEITIDEYTGRGLLAHSISGRISVKVHPGASGHLNAHTISGAIRVKDGAGRVSTTLTSTSGKVTES